MTIFFKKQLGNNFKMNNLSLKDRVVSNLKERQQRILSGHLNCIPSSFPRFSNDFIGIEQSCYYTVTSFTKGKFVLI
jgi:hypothetical protein